MPVISPPTTIAGNARGLVVICIFYHKHEPLRRRELFQWSDIPRRVVTHSWYRSGSVRIRRLGRGVLLERMASDTSQWFAALDEFSAEPFMAEGRAQPRTPRRKVCR